MKSAGCVPEAAGSNLGWGRMKTGIVLGAVASLLLGPAAVAAKPTPESPLVQALANCRGQTDDQTRLRCYDEAAAALTQATESGSVLVVDREDVRKTRRSLFGFSLPKLPLFSGDDSADSQQDEITAKVASASELGYNKFRIRLEDGAIWETTEGSATVFAPRRGDTVVIKRGSLGSYMIRIDGQRGLKAKRVG
jgi:hypothetical protein